MKTEFEVKILDIDVDEIREKLKKLGAKKVADRFFRRNIYDLPFEPPLTKRWLRLRSEEGKSTLTVKDISDTTITGTKELEIVVDDFDTTEALLKKLNLFPRAYQENKRESYTLDGVDVEIDTWPLIPSYVEVEGRSVEDVERVVKLLGFTMEETCSITTGAVFRKYGEDTRDHKRLTFETKSTQA